MPTPFVHLTYAMELLSHSDVAESLNKRLKPFAGAFLLGNTAADIQTLTRTSRLSTHFYRIRDAQPRWGWEMMLNEYSHLINPYHLDPEHSVFISGYLVHLLWDEIWTREIYAPYFMNATVWSDRLTYALHHNALRVLIDHSAQTELKKNKHIIDQVADVEPNNWLPFADDSVLKQWRDWLVVQLQDGRQSQTVQVLADRMGVTTRQFLSVINELKTNHQQEISGLKNIVVSAKNRSLAKSLDLLLWYWRSDYKIADNHSAITLQHNLDAMNIKTAKISHKT